jgi:hypothetical protein
MEIVGLVCERLRRLKADEIITKKQLNNILKGKPHLLTKARRMVEKETGVIFATIIGVGLKKLDPKMAHTVGVRAREKAVRGLKTAQGQIIGVIRETEGVTDAHTRLTATNELNKLGLAIEFCKA